jgi:hypothetical protein
MTLAQPTDRVFELEDSWDAVNQWFFERDMTDGLPIVPPTQARVAAMLDHAERKLGFSAQDIVGCLDPKRGVATIENIAANAVMAGCYPEYMPVLIAAVQAMSDPQFNLYAVQTSTHNTSVLPLVNGPIARAIDLNCGYNSTGSRWRSTATIGRALRLIMANIGGTPGSINIHTQGHIARYDTCIAENEAENPWEPLHVERGFSPGMNVVTVFPACPAAMIDERGASKNGKDLLKTIALSLAYVGNRNTSGEGEPLLILCPQHARMLCDGGYGKADVKRFLWERARVPYKDIPEGVRISLSQTNQKFYGDVDADYGVPIAGRPEDIAIVVMGGKGTHSLSVQTILGARSVSVPLLCKDGSPFVVQ